MSAVLPGSQVTRLNVANVFRQRPVSGSGRVEYGSPIWAHLLVIHAGGKQSIALSMTPWFT